MRELLLGALMLWMMAGCEPQPKACLDWGDTLEAGTTLNLESCSEDFDFLTWEFSDDRGYIGDNVERIFEDETSLSVRLTAYSDGGYRTDNVTHEFKTSFRYIDRMEVIGTSDFASFRLAMEGGSWSAGGAEGTFTEEAPFVVYVWPDDKQVIESTRNGGFTVYGVRNGNTSNLGSSPTYNFETYKDNPMVLESSFGLTFKVFWRFRD